MVKFKQIPKLNSKQTANFWAKVQIRGQEDCWLWTGCTDTVGYGQLSFSRGLGTFRAHRVALSMLMHIPQHLDVAHVCNNRRCVNPLHLKLATRKENNQDKETHGTKLLGSRTAKAVLKESDIPVIRDMCKTHLRKEVADMYGVSPMTISSIATNRYWKHIK
jgi:hypothetical protein